MQGYLLKEGGYPKEKLSDSQMWEAFNWLFSSRSKNDSSYKFLFLKAILDCLDQCSDEGYISFDILFEEFVKSAWDLVAKYGILQKRRAVGKKATYLEQIIMGVIDSQGGYVEFTELESSEKKKICKKVKNDCKKYVVGALYGDVKTYLYAFSKPEEWIRMNPLMVEFVKKNKSIIETLNYYKWSGFYEEINEDDVKKNIETMIDRTFVRNNESIYRAVLAYEFEYKEKKIEKFERVNTLELLFEAESVEEFADDAIVEKELFVDFNSMQEYISDPIMLIKQLKKEKGITS